MNDINISDFLVVRAKYTYVDEDNEFRHVIFRKSLISYIDGDQIVMNNKHQFTIHPKAILYIHTLLDCEGEV